MLLFMSFLAASQSKDTIFMYNGQILIGEVLGLQSGVLSLKEVDFKNLTIRLNKIKTIKTNRSFKVETTDKILYYGTLQPSYRDGWMDIVDNGEVLESIDIMSISLIVSY